MPYPANSSSDMMPMKAVLTLLRVVDAQGYDVDEVASSVGLAHNPMTNTNMQEQAVSTLVYSKLYKRVMDLLQDESFGLNNFGKFPPGTFRIMCLFIIHCKNLHHAMIRSAEFFDFLDSFIQQSAKHRNPVSLVDDDKLAICRFYNPNNTQPEHNLQADASVIYMMHRFYSWLIGRSIPLKEVCFKASPPADLKKYQDLFNCPVSFQQNDNVIKFSSDYLEYPITQTEESLRNFLRTAPYQLVSKKTNIDMHSLKARVRLMLEEEIHGEFPNIDSIAARMNISSRTLHRRLLKENSSFQKIKDEVRCDTAISFIKRPELTINAVSVLMGFQDTSAFYRAFKKWTGISPGDYRKLEMQ